MSGSSNAILHGDELTAEISPLGAELQRLVDRDGKDLLWDGDPAIWRGRAPILFPVIGMLNGGCYRHNGTSYPMPKHGFARASLFSLMAHDGGSATFRLNADGATRVIYPFEFQLDITFAIHAATLSISARIANLGDMAMPASFGFHPALRWPLPYGQPRADHVICFAEDELAPIRRIDAAGLLRPDTQPTPVAGATIALRDALFVDDAMILDALTSRSLTYGAPQAPRIEVTFPDFPMLGLWTKPGAGFLCIEPWHGVSDPIGFEGDIRNKPGIFEIEPFASRSMTMTIALVSGRSG